MHQTDPTQGELSFDLLAEIAVGATARVELCRVVDGPLAGELVAVKRLHPHIADDPQFLDMFRDEVWMTAALKHQHVVEVVGAGQDGHGPWLAVEFVRGVSLQRLMKTVFETGEMFTERMVVYLARSICDGLDAAHNLRTASGEPLHLVHRDMTPGNILLGFEGQVKITDFGLAKAKQRLTKTLTGLLKGQPQYMSPEQVNGRPLDGRSDIFALGVVLFELFSGRRPWNANTDLDVMRAITDDTPGDLFALRPRIDKALVDIVAQCLRKDPEQRWQSAGELRDRLDEWLTVHGYRSENHVSLARFVRRNAMRQMRWFERAVAGEFAEEAQANAPPPPRVNREDESHSDAISPEPIPEPVDWGEDGPTLVQESEPVHREAEAVRKKLETKKADRDAKRRAPVRRPPRRARAETVTEAHPGSLPRIGPDDEDELQTIKRNPAPGAPPPRRPERKRSKSDMDLGEVGRGVKDMFREIRQTSDELGVVAPPDPDVPPLPTRPGPPPTPAPPEPPASGVGRARQRTLPQIGPEDDEPVTRPDAPNSVRRGEPDKTLQVNDTAATKPLTLEDVDRLGLEDSGQSAPSHTAPFPQDALPGMVGSRPLASPEGQLENGDFADEAQRLGEAAQAAANAAVRAAELADQRARAAQLAGEAALMAATGQRHLALKRLREAMHLDEAIGLGQAPPRPPYEMDFDLGLELGTHAERRPPAPQEILDRNTMLLIGVVVVIFGLLLLVFLLK